MPDRFAPVEPAVRARRRAGPQHPGGEDTVEERLHQCRLKEARARVALEADAQGLFECAAHRPERQQVARRFDAKKGVARIGGEQPGQVLGFGNPRAIRERPAQVLAQPRADFAGKSARFPQPAIELLLAVSKAKGLEHGLATGRVRANEGEFAQVGHKY